MHTIHGLIVDDKPGWIDLMVERLDREFAKFDWKIVWETRTDVDEGRHLISAAAVPFDLVVADLLFPRKDLPDREENSGLDLVSDAQQRSGHTFILAISIAPEDQPDLLDAARRRGADHVVRRFEFSPTSPEHSAAALAHKIRSHLVDNGTVEVCKVTADDLDPAIQSLLRQVGRATIAGLHGKILEAAGSAAREIDVRFLAPGASGASVCVVTAQIGDARRVQHVLKVGRDRDLLADEAARCLEAVDVLPTQLLVPHRPDHPVGPVNGWYALGAPVVGGAATFRSWLSTGPPVAAVGEMLEMLLVQGMGGIYSDLRRAPVTVLSSYAFPPHRQLRILRAVEDLTPALDRPDGGNLAGSTASLAADLAAFVSEGRLPGVLQRSIPAHTHVSFAHGDLHGGNVLVATGRHPLPLLIDLSEAGEAHWAADPACLAADLLLSSVDAGAESMFWTGFGAWRTLVSQVGASQPELTAVSAAPGTAAALAALSWLVTNLPRFCRAMRRDGPAVGHAWEWHVALVAYLLRASYRADLPHPKRAVALAGAHDQLIAASASLRA